MGYCLICSYIKYSPMKGQLFIDASIKLQASKWAKAYGVQSKRNRAKSSFESYKTEMLDSETKKLLFVF